MLDEGMTHAEIADEFMRRYQVRPRTAFRNAHDWTLTQAAGHINGHAAELGIDPDGRCTVTESYLCELEHWPEAYSRRRPTPQILALLASTYGTDVHMLLDARDYARMRPADHLVIDAMTCVREPAACSRCRRREPAVSAASRPDALASTVALAVTAHPLPAG